MRLRTHIPALLLALVVLARPVPAQDATAVLDRIDEVLNAPNDMTAQEEMTLIETNGTQKTRVVKLYQKGSQLRMVQFLAPADVRGVGFLRLAADRLYLYLPAFRKVRRIASSATNEDFVGTDFTYEDLAQSTYAADYDPGTLRKQDGRYVLEVTPKPGAGVNYGRLVLYADPSNYVLRRVEYYDRSGTLEKVLAVDDVAQIDGYWIGRRMAMENQKTGHRTVLALSEIAFDQGLSDDLFSERSLKRPVR